MHARRHQLVSGHIYRVRRKRGSVWYWKVRLPHGGEERKLIGPVWTGTGRTPDGYFTQRSARAALEARLTDLRRGVGIPVRVSATFRVAAEAWFEYGATERDWKPSTRRDYRSALNCHLLPAFADHRIDAIDTAVIERWRSERLQSGQLPRRTAAKLAAILHAIFERARRQYGIAKNPVDDLEPIRLRYSPERYDFYSPEEVHALVRETEAPADGKAEAAAQDAAIFLTAAFSGLRLGELLALRVRDVDFEAESIRVLGSVDILEGIGTPKSGKGRTVPMVPDVAQVLARLLQREHFVGPDDVVFVGETGQHLDGSALRRRYKAAQKRAKLRALRFHDLRHTFGSLAIRELGTLDVQHLMGHADSRTTARYTHYKSRSDEARRLARAFAMTPGTAAEATTAKRRRGSGTAKGQVLAEE
jgi:integrase